LITYFKELCFKNVERANEKVLTRFIFIYNDKYYLCEWHKNKWSDPILVVRL